MYKVCKKCGDEKHITLFYLHKGMTDGRLSFCKECVKQRVREHAHTDRGRRIEREWLKTEKGRAKKKRNTQRYRRQYPEKYKATGIANRAIRGGTLIKMPCEICGNPKAEKHHDDYSKPLEVRWLCMKHHRLLPF